MRASLARAGIVLIVMALCGSTAYADVCSDAIARARSGGGQETVALTKQLAALNALAAKRQCSGKRRGGFFDPCADIANRKAEVQSKLAKSQGGGAAGLRARLAALGCTTERRKAVTVSKRSDERRIASGPYIGNNAMLFCVRPKDGYFFPVPSSQFVNSSDYKETVDQCRYICEDETTVIYRLDSPELETEEMVSVETGTPYKDLPTAFAYREQTNFQGCDFQRYYRRVEEARARTVTPRDMKNAVIPLPKEKPDVPIPLMALTSEEQAPAKEMPADRNVRVVGPNFFPE